MRIRRPGGFRLEVAAARRRWNTPDGRANFLLSPGFAEDVALGRQDALILTTIRSHDQYNTTIYGFDDRYRGVFGRRDVIFMNVDDLEKRGLKEGDRVDVQGPGNPDSGKNVIRGLTAVSYDIPKGSIAGYYPELNVVLPLSYFDLQSGTPSYKGIPVTVSPTAG